MKKNTIILMLVVTLMGILAVTGCSKKEEGNKESQTKQTITDGTREYSKISKESSSVDMIVGDTPDLYKQISGAIIIATCNEKLEDLNTEIDDDVIEGEKIPVNFKRYSCTVNEIISIKDAESFEGEFILAVGMAVSGVFPEFKEGDKVIIAVKKSSAGTPAEGCYLWTDISMFYIKDDGTIVAAYTEDSKYDGYTVDEFKALIVE